MRTLAILSLLSVTASAETALTIYNQSLAVVRETIPLDLKAGDSLQSFDRATACAEPDSVVLRDPSGKNAFSILEQSYRNDPVSQAMLLSHFEGREMDFRIAYPDGKTEVKPGKIVRSGYVPDGDSQDPIIEMDGKLRFQLPGQPLFPALGDHSILRPTLGWTIHSDAAAKFDAQLSYLSDGLQWQATYNAFDLIGERKVTHFARSERQKTIDETIEVTLRNHSQSPREIVVRERPWRWTNWQINNSSSPFNKIDAQKIEFTVKLPPGEEKKVTYTVHYNW